jgi:hypothetical protein
MILSLVYLFVAKILYSPLFPSSPCLNLHQTVLFSDTDMLLMDYVPNLSVTNQVIWDLCIGKSIPGKIRIFHFTKPIHYQENIMERVQEKIDQGDYYNGSESNIIPILRIYGVDQVVQSQDNNYQLYTNNCWHFSKKCLVSTYSVSRE